MSNEPTRFTRSTPGVIVPFFWGIGFIVLSVGLWQYGPTIATGHNVLLPYGFSVLLLLLGLATVWSCFYQIALKTFPAATIHVPNNRFRLGPGNRVSVVQPGKSYFSFLRLQLKCIEQRTTRHKRASRQPDGQLESYTKTKESILFQQTLVEVSDLHVQSGAKWERTESFSIPSDAKPSREGDSTNIVWRLELSGRSGLLIRFLHSFEVRVLA